MVQLLLEYGADPNYGDENGRTPLHWYAIRDKIAPMRAILHLGAEVNTDGDFEKPIHEAAQRNLDTVQLLVEHGADVRGRDMNGNTPLHLAVRAGKTDVVKFLVEQWPEGTRETNERQATPLRLAAAAREVDLAKFLVKQWPEGMRERDDCLNMPLHWAALGGQTELVELLVEGWPEGVREKNRFGDTPLHLAAMHASRKAKTDSKMIRLLLERWPERNEALNNDGKTPLWWFEDSKLQPSDEGREGIDEAKEKAFFTYFWCALD
jgi:ankyrin repeat protein